VTSVVAESMLDGLNVAHDVSKETLVVSDPQCEDSNMPEVSNVTHVVSEKKPDDVVGVNVSVVSDNSKELNP